MTVPNKTFSDQLKEHIALILAFFALLGILSSYITETTELKLRVEDLEKKAEKTESLQTISNEKIIKSMESISQSIKGLSDEIIIIKTKLELERKK
jgi:hypothetical protein